MAPPQSCSIYSAGIFKQSVWHREAIYSLMLLAMCANETFKLMYILIDITEDLKNGIMCIFSHSDWPMEKQSLFVYEGQLGECR